MCDLVSSGRIQFRLYNFMLPQFEWRKLVWRFALSTRLDFSIVDRLFLQYFRWWQITEHHLCCSRNRKRINTLQNWCHFGRKAREFCGCKFNRTTKLLLFLDIAAVQFFATFSSIEFESCNCSCFGHGWMSDKVINALPTTNWVKPITKTEPSEKRKNKRQRNVFEEYAFY